MAFRPCAATDCLTDTLSSSRAEGKGCVFKKSKCSCRAKSLAHSRSSRYVEKQKGREGREEERKYGSLSHRTGKRGSRGPSQAWFQRPDGIHANHHLPLRQRPFIMFLWICLRTWHVLNPHQQGPVTGLGAFGAGAAGVVSEVSNGGCPCTLASELVSIRSLPL